MCCCRTTAIECDCGRGGPHVIHLSQLRPADKVRRYQAILA